MTPFETFPRVRFSHLPTPIERLNRLGSAIGLSALLIKRDDCTGLGTGGNKARKLEFLLGAAIEMEADIIVTGGAVQSNHARQAAAAAARYGISCHLILTAPPPSRGLNYAKNGNRLLAELFGAHVSHVSPDVELNTSIVAEADRLSADGHRAYAIPVGGSNGRGALGYLAAGFEIANQLRYSGDVVSRIVLATGSGGTQAGLLLGLALAGLNIPVDGISVGAKSGPQTGRVRACLRELEALLGCYGRVPLEAVRVHDDYIGTAYGEPTEAMIQAVRFTASTEGLLLDPVYTGKAMAGLADLTRRGVVPTTDSVLFLHTGGVAALFAYDTILDTYR
jgi:L-cysteate sulfo-lyase